MPMRQQESVCIKEDCMRIEMSKTKRILFYIAIMLTNVAIMGELVITPIIYNFYEEFAYNMAGVNFIVSGPPLIMVVASLIASKLCSKTTKKNIIIIGCAFFTVGAVFGAVNLSIPFMIAMRVLVGIGEGFVNVAAMAMIAEVYVDEQKRSTFMGIYNAIMAAMGALMSACAGMIAESGWVNAFKVYWIAIPMLITAILFLPSIKLNEEIQNKTNIKKEPLGKAYMLMMVSYVLFNLAYAMITYYVSTYVQEHSLGTSSFTGIMTAMGTVGSTVICMGFGFIYQKLSSKTAVLAQIMGAVSVAIFLFAPGKVTAIAAMVIIGAAYGVLFSYAYAHGAAIVPVSRIDDAMGYATIGYSLPMFCSTYLVTFLMNNVFHTDKITLVWSVALGIYVFCIIFCIITSMGHKKGEKM